MRSQTETTPATLKEAKREVRGIIAELKAIGKRLEPIRDAIPRAPEPMRTLMQNGYIPSDEAEMLWGDLDCAARSAEDSDILGAAINYLEYSMSWSSRKRRELLFMEANDLDNDPPPAPLSMEEFRNLEAEAGDLPEDTSWRLGLTLSRMDPTEEAFLETLSTIARLKIRRSVDSLTFGIKRAMRERRPAPIHFESAKYAADSLESALAALEDCREAPECKDMRATLGALRRLQGVSEDMLRELQG